MATISYKTTMENIKLAAYKLISLDKIPSTQFWAHDLIAKKSATDKTIITATAQTTGHGRYGRNWVSHSGNLYASFIFKITKRNPKLSYAMGVAVAETLIHFGLNPKIKWPNDILIDDKKISGILIEYNQNFVVIGIGINIKSAPTVKEYHTAKMDDYVKTSVVDVLNVLIKKIDFWRNANFDDVRKRWIELAFGIDKKIKYHNKKFDFVGLSDDGALILRDDKNDVFIYGDEIVF